MKKIYTLIAAALLATGAAAQNPTAYFMEGSTFRSQFNPAFAPQREKKRICHAKKARPFGILDAPISLSGKAIANPETFSIFAP